MIACRISRERATRRRIDRCDRARRTDGMRTRERTVDARNDSWDFFPIHSRRRGGGYDAASHRIETRRFVREMRVRIGWMMCGCCRVFCFVSTSSIFFLFFFCGIFLDVDEWTDGMCDVRDDDDDDK